MKNGLSFDERMALEAAERRTRYAALVELGRGVAAAMGGSWTLREAEGSEGNAHLDSFRGYVNLANPDGRLITLTIDQHGATARVQRETLTIDGRFDYGDSSLGIGFPYGKTHPRIYVNMTRGAAVIAREINRRFLPAYTALCSEIAERVRSAAEYRDKQNGLVGRLVAVVGKVDNLRRTSEREFRFWSDGVGSLHAEVKVGNGEVDVKIENLSEAEAAEVLRLLAPYFAKRKGGV